MIIKRLPIVLLVVSLVGVASWLLLSAPAVSSQGGEQWSTVPASVSGWVDYSINGNSLTCDLISGPGYFCTAVRVNNSDGAYGEFVLGPAPANAVGLLIVFDHDGTLWQYNYANSPSVHTNTGPSALGTSGLNDVSAGVYLSYNNVGANVGLPGAVPSWIGVSQNGYDLMDGVLPDRVSSNFRLRAAGQFAFRNTTKHMLLYPVWLVYGVPTPTPTATIQPTPTPEPTGFGLTCTYTETVTGTGTITHTISANVLQNASFEAGLAGWYPMMGGLVGDGSWSVLSPDPIAVDGFASLWKPEFLDTGLYSWLVQDVGLSLADGPYHVQFGASIRAGGGPGEYRQAGMSALVPGLGSSYPLHPDDIEWRSIAGEQQVNGGGARIGVYAGRGAVAVYYDAVYAHVFTQDDQGNWVLECPSDDNEIFIDPGPTATPGAIPTVPPLGTLAPTPTLGPQPTLPPPVGITPQPTQCYEVNPDLSSLPGEYDFPGVRVCIEPAALSFDQSWLTGEAGSSTTLNALIMVLLTAGIVLVVIGLFRIGQ